MTEEYQDLEFIELEIEGMGAGEQTNEKDGGEEE